MKVLRNIILVLSLAAMSSTNLDAMKRKHEDANVCQETHILVLPQDLMWVITQYLDGKAFSAFTQICKSNESILNAMPVQYLWYVNCADAITHGNANLTRRFLASPCGTGLLERAGKEKLGKPGEIGSICKFLCGGQKIYGVDKNSDAPDITIYYWITKGSADNSGCQLAFCSQETITTDDQKAPRDLFGTEIDDDLNENEKEFLKKFDQPKNPVACGNINLKQYIKDHMPSDVLVTGFFLNNNQADSDICFINTPELANRERVRFDYFCLNMLFIVAAQKNLTAIIDVFLQEKSVCKQIEIPALVIANGMTTCSKIQVVLTQELNKRFVVAAEKNDSKSIERFLLEESIAQHLTKNSLVLALDITTDDVIKQVLELEITRRKD